MINHERSISSRGASGWVFSLGEDYEGEGMTDEQAVAKIVLEAHRDDIQGKIDKLWQYNDKVLEEGERKLLQHMLDKVNEALEWARGIEGKNDRLKMRHKRLVSGENAELWSMIHKVVRLIDDPGYTFTFNELKAIFKECKGWPDNEV